MKKSAIIDICRLFYGAAPYLLLTNHESFYMNWSGFRSSSVDKIIMAGVELLISLVTNLPTIIIEIVKAIPKIITGIVEAFLGFIPKLAEVGGDLLKGVWQGLANAAEWLWEKIKGLFSGIMSKIKGFFGISSPSTLFAGIGVNLAEGLGFGFEKEMENISRDMRNAIPTSFDTNVHANVTSDMVNGLVGGLFYPTRPPSTMKKSR